MIKCILGSITNFSKISWKHNVTSFVQLLYKFVELNVTSTQLRTEIKLVLFQYKIARFYLLRSKVAISLLYN